MADTTIDVLTPSRGTASWDHNTLCKALLVLLIGIQAIFCWMARDRSLRGDVDLRSFYAAGVTVRTGHAAHLYDAQAEAQTQRTLFPSSDGQTLPFLYPAFAALPFVPLSVLPYPVVFLFFLLVNLGCLFACACLFVRDRTGGVSRWGLFGIFLCSMPVSMALMQGQVSCILLLLFVTFHTLLQHRRPFLGGLLLSLGLIKFQLALPFMLLYLLGRRWRAVAGFVSGGSVLVVVSLLMTGIAGCKQYLARLHGVGTSMLLHPAAAQHMFGMQAAAEPNLHGLVTTLAHSGAMDRSLTLVCSLGTLAWAARQRLSAGIALPAAMLVSYHMQPYDLVLLLLPISLLIAGEPAMNFARRPLATSAAVASAAMLAVPVAAYLVGRGETVWFVAAIAGVMLAFASLQEHSSAATFDSHV